MGLVGPSKREMTDAVSDGVNQAIKITHHRHYKIKIGRYKMPRDRKVLYIMPQVGISNVEFGGQAKPPEPIEITEDVNDIIYEVEEVKYSTEFNPFTNETREYGKSEHFVARYYQHEGWSENKVADIIGLSEQLGYWAGDMIEHYGVTPMDRHKWRELRLLAKLEAEL